MEKNCQNPHEGVLVKIAAETVVNPSTEFKQYEEWTNLRDVNEKTRMYEDQPNFRDLNKISEC